MTVYVDVLFAVNLGMDLVLLGLVKRLLGLGARRRRLWAGAAVGASLACGQAAAGASWPLPGCGIPFLRERDIWKAGRSWS